MTQFANLPDDCYYLILVRLSTSTLLSCRRVSRAWLRNQQNVFRGRKALILLQGNSPVELFAKSKYQGNFISHGIDQNGQPMDFDHFLQHNQVKLRSFDQNVTRFLAVTFSNLNTLIVVHDGIMSRNVNKPLLDLLQLYSSQVVTLKLYFNYRGEPLKLINSDILKVIRRLNSMSALEHVTLELPFYHSTDSLKMCNRNLQFLTQVKQFYFYSRVPSPSWIDVLRRLEQNGSVSQLEQIGIGSLCPMARPIVNWPLANRFTHFPTGMLKLNFYLQSIGHFGSLTTFSIHDFGFESIASRLTTLSRQCPSLVHISIKITKNCLFVQPFDPATVKPFESVKALDLEFERCDLTNVITAAQVHPLVYTFPNLVSIKIARFILFYPSVVYQQYLDVTFGTFFRQLKTAFGRESLRTSFVPN